LEDRSVFVGEWLDIDFEAFDPDDDDPFFGVSTDPQIDIELDNSSGEFSYFAVPKDIGSVKVTVTVTDNNGSMDQDEFVIVVNFRNLPPEVEPIPDLRTSTDVRMAHQLNFSDPNGDKVSVRVESSETPFSIDIDGQFLLSFIPHPGQEGDYRAVLNFSDNNGTFTLVGFRIVVLHVNKAPGIMPISDMEAEPGQEFSYQVVVIEDDPDILTFSLNYSGTGDASIDQTGLIRITPDVVDVGIQTVSVEVDDNNGSVVLETFHLMVYMVNHPPVVPGNILVRVEAGGRMTVRFDVLDPDGEKVYVLPDENIPDWAIVNEDALVMVLAPILVDTGRHIFTIRFMDDEFEGANMEVEILVEGTIFPEWAYPGEHCMMERESVVFDLGFGYGGNGTPWYHITGLKGFMSIEGSRLSLSPEDGDSGSHMLNISYGIMNGTTAVSRNLMIIVDRNLSTFWLEVHLEPDKEVYGYGEPVWANRVYGGYDGSIETIWVWGSGDLLFERCSGVSSSVYLNISGEWYLYLFIDEGAPPIYSKSFMVNGERREEDAFPWSRTIMIIVAVLIASLVLLLVTRKVMKVVRGQLEEARGDGTTDIVLPEGFRSAPRMNYQNEEQYFESSDNDYTAVDDSATHDTLDRRGEDAPRYGT
ncbi:MAG: hypothetical protein JXA22_07665, partial [Candidatus Thermoplasmatota archaeon]|nr:hypothetical protein [Candidatus Thermoplasmatota archaeon]